MASLWRIPRFSHWPWYRSTRCGWVLDAARNGPLASHPSSGAAMISSRSRMATTSSGACWTARWMVYSATALPAAGPVVPAGSRRWATMTWSAARPTGTVAMAPGSSAMKHGAPGSRGLPIWKGSPWNVCSPTGGRRWPSSSSSRRCTVPTGRWAHNRPRCKPFRTSRSSAIDRCCGSRWVSAVTAGGSPCTAVRAPVRSDASRGARG